MYGSNNQDTVEFLLDSGARLPALSLHFIAANADADAELVACLLKRVDQSKSGLSRKLNLQNYPRSIVWYVAHRIARLCIFLGSKNNVAKVLAWQHGATPLHYAVGFGNLSTARLLAGVGAQQEVKNAQGLRACDLARKIYGSGDAVVLNKFIKRESRCYNTQRSNSNSARVEDSE